MCLIAQRRLRCRMARMSATHKLSATADDTISDRAMLERALIAIEQVMAALARPGTGCQPARPRTRRSTLCLTSPPRSSTWRRRCCATPIASSPRCLPREWQAIIGHTKNASRTAHQAVLRAGGAAEPRGRAGRGSPVVAAASTALMALVCPSCGTENRSVAKFCIECIGALPVGFAADADRAPPACAARRSGRPRPCPRRWPAFAVGRLAARRCHCGWGESPHAALASRRRAAPSPWRWVVAALLLGGLLLAAGGGWGAGWTMRLVRSRAAAGDRARGGADAGDGDGADSADAQAAQAGLRSGRARLVPDQATARAPMQAVPDAGTGCRRRSGPMPPPTPAAACGRGRWMPSGMATVALPASPALAAPPVRRAAAPTTLLARLRRPEFRARPRAARSTVCAQPVHQRNGGMRAGAGAAASHGRKAQSDCWRTEDPLAGEPLLRSIIDQPCSLIEQWRAAMDWPGARRARTVAAPATTASQTTPP